MTTQGLGTRELRLALALTAAVVLLRLALVHSLTFCGTPDACYYLGTAQSLAAGQGFHSRFLYDLLQPHPALPDSGIVYWRPGISLLLFLLRPLGGVTLRGSIFIATLVGVAFAAAAWHIALRCSGDRRLALASYSLCLLGPSCWIGSLAPDSGIFYGACVAWFLALFTVRRQGLWQDLTALFCVALCYLIRNDAALLLLPLLAVLWRRYQLRQQLGHQAGNLIPGSSLPYALAMLAGFALALAPMHLLYREILGTAFPSGTEKAFFLDELSDFARYGDPVNLHTLLAHGLAHLVTLRAVTFTTVVYRLAALSIGYATLIFLPVPFLRRSGVTPLPELTGATVFFVAALLAYTLVLPAVGQFSLLRTATGVFPLVAVLAILGIDRAAATPGMASFLVAAVLAANFLAGIMDTRRDVATRQHDGAHVRAEAAGLVSLGADPRSAIVVTGDPVQFSVTTGFASVALPSNGLSAIDRAAHDLHATYILFDETSLPSPLPDLRRQLHPVRTLELPAEHTLILELPRS